MMLRRSVLVLLMAFLSGCAVSGQGRTAVVDPDTVPFGLLDPDAPPLVPPATAGSGEDVTLCFVREGGLVTSQTRLQPPVALIDALRALAQPPEQSDQVRTALNDPAIVGDVELAGGVARVDLRRAISTLGGDDQLLAVAQIVCTLTGRPGVGQVSFTLEGVPAEVPRGDGSLVAAPVARDDYATMVP